MAQPPTTQAPWTSLQLQLIDAYSKMRTGALLLIVSWLLFTVAIFAILSVILDAILTPIGFGGPYKLGELAIEKLVRIGAMTAIGALIFLIAFVIGLIGILAMFVPGTRGLARADASFSTASKLISVGYIEGFIVLIGGGILMLIAAVAFRSPDAALGVLWIFLIGGILILIGHIGVIILAFELYKKEGETLYLVAGILMVLLLLPYSGAALNMIAWILFYLALGRSIEKLKLQPPSPGVSAQPV